MAKIIMGMGTSHGPMLSTAPEEWGQRRVADIKVNELFLKGQRMDFDEMTKARAHEGFEKQLTMEIKRERHTACQKAISSLADTFARVSPDVAVIIGDDQEELLFDDNMPALMVYWGDSVDNVPLTTEQSERRGPGLAIADWGHSPPQPTVNPCEPALARHMIDHLMAEEFDVAHSRKLPPGRNNNRSIPHAYGFIYRRIMNDEVIPNVPVFINTFYPPNQPSLTRCYDFGRAIGQAIASWKSDKTVAVVASGGLTHFVIEEDIDQEILDALKAGDGKRLTSMAPELFMAGTSEIRNWIALAGVVADTDLRMDLVDYVPCYRSEAGTGNAMGFATWM